MRLTSVACAAWAANASPCSIAMKKSVGPATMGMPASHPPTLGPQRLATNVTAAMRAGERRSLRMRRDKAPSYPVEHWRGNRRDLGRQFDKRTRYQTPGATIVGSKAARGGSPGRGGRSRSRRFALDGPFPGAAVDRRPEALRGEGHVDVADAEGRERVDGRIHEGRRDGDAARLAQALGAQRIAR